MSFIQIYSEKITDLLKPGAKLTLRYVGRDSKIENLMWVKVNSVEEALAYVWQAKANRATASTSQNATSSRSHCIITVKIEITTKDGNSRTSKLNFGDLAGSEKMTKTMARGQRAKEAKDIVQSLFALKKVIRSLAEKKAFVPYQESVLTKLLRDSLGGNCFTTIVITASPHEFNRSETISTLRFGETAKKITNKVEVNRILSRGDMMKRMNKMQDQIDYLEGTKKKAKKITKAKENVERELKQMRMKYKAMELSYANTNKELIELKHDLVNLNRELSRRDFLISVLKMKLDTYENAEEIDESTVGQDDSDNEDSLFDPFDSDEEI